MPSKTLALCACTVALAFTSATGQTATAQTPTAQTPTAQTPTEPGSQGDRARQEGPDGILLGVRAGRRSAFLALKLKGEG